MDIDKILGEFSAADGDANAYFEALKRVANSLGYDHAIAAYAPKAGERKNAFLASTYSQEWMREQSQLEMNDVLRDPIVSHLSTRVDPIFWSKRNYDDVGLAAFYEHVKNKGLGSGIALAVRGVRGEMLSVGFSNSEQLSSDRNLPVEQMGALYLSATAMFNRFLDIEEQRKFEMQVETPKLTPRELECLRWSRSGKTSWEIAKILGISQATAIFHMKNAISKLGASNKTHAVIMAVELQLIS